MGIRQDWANLKTMWAQGSDLLMLRLRLLRLDANAQLAAILNILAMLAAVMVLSLVGLIALLFGLNVVLPETWKMGVFFGVAVVAWLLCVMLVWRIPRLWRDGSERMGETLAALHNDVRMLRGQKNIPLEQHDDTQKPSS